MIVRRWMVLGSVVMAGGLVAWGAAQDGMGGTQPTKHHEHLKQFEGTWEAKAKVHVGPGTPAIDSEGVEVCTLGCDGLWVIMDYKAEDMMGSPFHGHGLLGYDPEKKKHVGVWVDNMLARMDLTEGTCEQDGKVLTMWSEGKDPQSGKVMKIKQVTEFKDKDHKTFTMTTDGPDGKAMLLLEVEYTRKK